MQILTVADKQFNTKGTTIENTYTLHTMLLGVDIHE